MFFTGIVLIVLNQTIKCQPKVVYQYLPRDLDAYMREADSVSLAAQNMFEDDAWLDSQGRGPIPIQAMPRQDLGGRLPVRNS